MKISTLNLFVLGLALFVSSAAPVSALTDGNKNSKVCFATKYLDRSDSPDQFSAEQRLQLSYSPNIEPNESYEQVMGRKAPPGQKPKIALVLGGGGTRGAAHLGVLRVLEQYNMKPDLVVANSMGAVIGALYCAGVPLPKIEELCTSGKMKRAFAPLPVPIQLVKKVLNPLVLLKRGYPGFYSGKSLAKFIDKSVGEENAKIENLKIPLAIAVTNLLDGQVYRVTEGELGETVRASCSLPPIFKPIVYKDMVLADGGIRANLPTYPARALGADVIIAVNVDEKLKNVDVSEIKNYAGLVNRVTTIVLAVRDAQLSKEADVVLQPDVSGISLMSVAKKDYKKAIDAGELAAVEQLPKLRAAFFGNTALTQSPESEQATQ